MNNRTFVFYNLHMRKIKIFTTVLLLYEFVILTILQVHNYCVLVFNINFCKVSFRYFLLCIVVPVLVWLFLWWLPDMSKMFCKKCECDNLENKEHLHENNVNENMSTKALEHLITSAIIIGIQKFAKNHPNTQNIFNNIFDALAKTSKPKSKKN